MPRREDPVLGKRQRQLIGRRAGARIVVHVGGPVVSGRTAEREHAGNCKAQRQYRCYLTRTVHLVHSTRRDWLPHPPGRRVVSLCQTGRLSTSQCSSLSRSINGMESTVPRRIDSLRTSGRAVVIAACNWLDYADRPRAIARDCSRRSRIEPSGENRENAGKTDWQALEHLDEGLRGAAHVERHSCCSGESGCRRT